MLYYFTSEIGTTSLQGTNILPPKCPLFGDSTVDHVLYVSCTSAIPRVQIDPSGPELTIDVGAQLSLFCSDMRTEPEELEQLRWFRNGERLETGGNIVVFPKTGELVISDMQVSVLL